MTVVKHLRNHSFFLKKIGFEAKKTKYLQQHKMK